eukprot:2367731-Pyramimonas_sp.AAC.1
MLAFHKARLASIHSSHNASIAGRLQVQSDHYEEFFAPEMQKAGYTAVYKMKTAAVYTGSSYTIDGCATFFRTDRFTLVKKYEVEFNKAALSLSEALSAANQKKAALNRLLKVRNPASHAQKALYALCLSLKSSHPIHPFRSNPRRQWTRSAGARSRCAGRARPFELCIRNESPRLVPSGRVCLARIAMDQVYM